LEASIVGLNQYGGLVILEGETEGIWVIAIDMPVGGIRWEF